jgi:hypothetical protein
MVRLLFKGTFFQILITFSDLSLGLGQNNENITTKYTHLDHPFTAKILTSKISQTSHKSQSSGQNRQNNFVGDHGHQGNPK